MPCGRQMPSRFLSRKQSMAKYRWCWSWMNNMPLRFRGFIYFLLLLTILWGLSHLRYVECDLLNCRPQKNVPRCGCVCVFFTHFSIQSLNKCWLVCVSFCKIQCSPNIAIIIRFTANAGRLIDYDFSVFCTSINSKEFILLYLPLQIQYNATCK